MREKSITVNQLIHAFKSKQLIILYCDYLSKYYDALFLLQCQGMWLHHKRRSRKFATYLFYQLLNKNRSPVITHKLKNVFMETLRYDWSRNKFLVFCKKYQLFNSALRKEPEFLELLILILGFNFLFFDMLSFSLKTLKKIRVQKVCYLKYLFKYCSAMRSEKRKYFFDLFIGLEQLKCKTVSEAHKNLLKINIKNTKHILNLGYASNLFPFVDNNYERLNYKRKKKAVFRIRKRKPIQFSSDSEITETETESESESDYYYENNVPFIPLLDKEKELYEKHKAQFGIKENQGKKRPIIQRAEDFITTNILANPYEYMALDPEKDFTTVYADSDDSAFRTRTKKTRKRKKRNENKK